MKASVHSSANLFSQLLMPLQGVVDFFSPPVVISSPTVSAMPSFSGKAIAAQPRLAKAPTFPLNAKSASKARAQEKIQPAGIRLVGRGLMGQMNHGAAGMTAEQILRSRRAQDGRIVISGRMRDVCAELDRLCDERA